MAQQAFLSAKLYFLPKNYRLLTLDFFFKNIWSLQEGKKERKQPDRAQKEGWAFRLPLNLEETEGRQRRCYLCNNPLRYSSQRSKPAPVVADKGNDLKLRFQSQGLFPGLIHGKIKIGLQISLGDQHQIGTAEGGRIFGRLV